MSKKEKFQVVMMQARQSQLLAEHFKVRIETGVYKERLGHRFKFVQDTHNADGPITKDVQTVPCTEEELLRDEVKVMLQHIRNAQDCLEAAMGMYSEED